jgi:2-dehydropantoate 2-reductase
LLARPSHADAVRARGLTLEGLFGTHRVSGLRCVSDARELDGPYAAVLLTVKAYDTAAVVRAVGAHLAADGFLLSLQNGLGNLEAAAAVVGAERVLGARVIFGAEMPEPGRARVTVYADPVLVGSVDPDDGRRREAAVRWAAHLAAAGVPSEPTDTLVAALWAKVLYNAALNPLGALLGVPYGALAEDPDTRAIMDDVIGEAFAVATADGVELPWPDARGYRDTFYGRLVPVTAAHRSSMLQDIERGRPTEIDAINGHVAVRAAARGMAAPANAMLTGLIHARVRRKETGWSR